MEANDTVKEFLEKVEDLSKNSSFLWSDLLEKELTSLQEVEKVREELRNLYASMAVIYEGSDSFRAIVRKSEELLSFGLSLVNEALNKIYSFNDITLSLSSKMEELISKKEEINTIMEELESLNEISANTARNAEIKAYQAGSSGKGFEVVAEELGRMTGRALDSVREMVEKLEDLKIRSKEARERFEKIRENLSGFIEKANELKGTSDKAKDKISFIIETSERLFTLLEELTRRRKNIEDATNSFFSFLKNRIARFLEIDSLFSQGEALKEIFKNHIELFMHLLEKNSDFLPIVISQLNSFLKKMSIIGQDSSLGVSGISLTKFTDNLELSAIFEMRNLFGVIGREIENSKEIIKEMKNQAKNSFGSILNVESFIQKNLEVVGEVANIEINLSRISSSLIRLVENIEEFIGHLRGVALYGKIEASRIQEDIGGLSVIVEEMYSLSENYTKLGDKLNRFFYPIKEKIEDIKTTTITLERIVHRLKDIVEESKRAFKENEEQIESLGEVAESIRPFIDDQEDVVTEIEATLKNATKEFKESSNKIKELESNLNEEKALTEAFIQDENWKSLSFGIGEKGKRSTLKVHLKVEPLSLDPLYEDCPYVMQVLYLLHRGLFDCGFSGKIYPFLVDKWELSEDFKKFYFVIRNDVISSKGKNIDSEDVKYSIERIMGTDNIFFPINKVEISGKYSFSVFLEEVNPSFLYNLSLLESSVLSKGNKNGIDGIGPFKLAEWRKGEEIILESNPNYFFGVPYLSNLIFRIAENPIEEFKSGKIDIIMIDYEDFIKVKTKDIVAGNIFPSSYSINYLGFNFSIKDLPFSNSKVRQALNYAINRRTLIEEYSYGLTQPIDKTFSSELCNYDLKIDLYNYDEDKAKRLLQEAGFPGGLPETYTLSVCDFPTFVKRAEFLQESFSRIGIKLKIEKSSWRKFLKKIQEKKTQLFLHSYTLETKNPINFLINLFYSSSKWNFSFYSNKILDNKIKEIQREVSPIKRIKLYEEAERMILEETPLVFLDKAVNFILVRENVFGFHSGCGNRIHYEWVGVE